MIVYESVLSVVMMFTYQSIIELGLLNPLLNKFGVGCRHSRTVAAFANRSFYGFHKLVVGLLERIHKNRAAKARGQKARYRETHCYRIRRQSVV